MLRKPRISMARMMGIVLLAAIGFAALRSSSEAWAGVMLLLTCGALMLAMIGALCRGPDERAGWLGFALFGGGYLALAHWTSSSSEPLPTTALAEFIGPRLGLPLPGVMCRSQGWNSLPPAYRIWHCLWALALAAFGTILAGVLVSRPAVSVPDRADASRSGPRLLPSLWKRTILIGLSGFWILATISVARRWPASGFWAGSSFLMTCALLGIAALAAVFSRGRDRPAWLGAALFGFGYLALTFGESQLFIVAPHLPTEGFLNSLLQTGGPPIESGFPDFTTSAHDRVKNDLIRRKLDQSIPMHFPNGTPLDEVLKYIRGTTRETNFPGIPIYVDPVGLQNAERSLNSPVEIDLDAVPVKDALSLCLKQLGLGYNLRTGYIQITDDDSATIPVYEDPVQVVGHSFLALAAAAIGALLAPFVTGHTRRAQGRAGAAVRDDGPVETMTEKEDP